MQPLPKLSSSSLESCRGLVHPNGSWTNNSVTEISAVAITTTQSPAEGRQRVVVWPVKVSSSWQSLTPDREVSRHCIQNRTKFSGHVKYICTCSKLISHTAYGKSQFSNQLWLIDANWCHICNLRYRWLTLNGIKAAFSLFFVLSTRILHSTPSLWLAADRCRIQSSTDHTQNSLMSKSYLCFN